MLLLSVSITVGLELLTGHIVTGALTELLPCQHKPVVTSVFPALPFTPNCVSIPFSGFFFLFFF